MIIQLNKQKVNHWNIIFIALAILAFAVSAQAQNTNIDYLTLGASMNYLYEGDEDGPPGGDGRHHMIDLSPEYFDAHTNYLAWKSNNIHRLIGDWTNGTLSAGDEQYTRIIECDYLYRAKFNRYNGVDTNHCEQYFSAVRTAGEAAMRKGYRREPLTTNDWQDLRVFRMLDDVLNVGPNIVPSRLGMTYQLGEIKNFDLGMDAPDIRLPKMETVLARSNYTDGVRVDPVQGFYDRGTNRYARMFSGYTTNGAAPYEVRALEVTIPPGETTNDFVEIGVVRDKPMVLIPAQLSDGYWWEYVCHDINPIYSAYKDVADFYFIHLQYIDTSARSWEYFGTNAGHKICSMDMETPEELAAEAKNQWMTYPWFSVPTLLDPIGSRARNGLPLRGGGGAYYLIVDVNGKVAYDGRRVVFANSNISHLYAEDFTGPTAWVNLMERELIKVLDNDGEYVPTDIAGWGEVEWAAFEAPATVADRRTALITDATVDWVSAVSNIVVISKVIGGSTNQFTLEIGPDTRLSKQEEAGDLSTFAPGDTVTVKFWTDTYPSVTCTTNRAYNTIPGEIPIGRRVVRYEVSGDAGDGIIHYPRQLNEDSASVSSRRMTWLSGTLESVSSTSRQVTVSLNADTNAMHGWKYWQEAGGSATLWGEAAVNMGVVSQWVGAVQSSSNWTFVIDDDVDLFLNAENVAYDDLVVGNPVSLLYRTYQNGNQVEVYPEVLRLSVSDVPTNPPTNATIIINNGDSQTTNFVVTLALFAENPTPVDMQISELSDFSDVGWINYQTNYIYTFGAPFGTKTIYAHFSDGGGGISETVSDTINLVPEPGMILWIVGMLECWNVGRKFK